MSTRTQLSDGEIAVRRGKARRTALLLALLAAGVYLGFIALQVLRVRHA